GSEWRSPDGGGASADHIMRRRCGATPRTEPLAPFDEVFGADWGSVWAFADGEPNTAYEGLGRAACAEPSAGSGRAAAETDGPGGSSSAGGCGCGCGCPAGGPSGDLGVLSGGFVVAAHGVAALAARLSAVVDLDADQARNAGFTHGHPVEHV